MRLLWLLHIYAYSESGTEKEDGVTYSYTDTDVAYFFDDGVWCEIKISKWSGDGESDTEVDPKVKGTYTHTGDFKNDTIAITLTHYWSNSAEDWKEYSGGTKTRTVTDGSIAVDGKVFTKQ